MSDGRNLFANDSVPLADVAPGATKLIKFINNSENQSVLVNTINNMRPKWFKFLHWSDEESCLNLINEINKANHPVGILEATVNFHSINKKAFNIFLIYLINTLFPDKKFKDNDEVIEEVVKSFIAQANALIVPTKLSIEAIEKRLKEMKKEEEESRKSVAKPIAQTLQDFRKYFEDKTANEEKKKAETVAEISKLNSSFHRNKNKIKKFFGDDTEVPQKKLTQEEESYVEATTQEFKKNNVTTIKKEDDRTPEEIKLEQSLRIQFSNLSQGSLFGNSITILEERSKQKKQVASVLDSMLVQHKTNVDQQMSKAEKEDEDVEKVKSTPFKPK